MKGAAPSGPSELHELEAETLTELRARMDSLCDMIENIDHKVQTALVDDADWMLLRIVELEAATGIACSTAYRSRPSSTSNVEEGMPEKEPLGIQQLQDKLRILAERVSHVASILGMAESDEDSNEGDVCDEANQYRDSR